MLANYPSPTSHNLPGPSPLQALAITPFPTDSFNPRRQVSCSAQVARRFAPTDRSISSRGQVDSVMSDFVAETWQKLLWHPSRTQ